MSKISSCSYYNVFENSGNILSKYITTILPIDSDEQVKIGPFCRLVD